MRIEKINENQIRCTLDLQDLTDSQMNLMELAYGTDKARTLFFEMMQKAYEEVNFRADGVPLMIEAVPVAGEGITLIISKIEDPEELDVRFSKFAPSLMESAGSAQNSGIHSHVGAEEVLQALRRFFPRSDAPAGEQAAREKAPEKPQEPAPEDLTRTFIFRTLDDLIDAASVLAPAYRGENSLYKNPSNGIYYLVIRKSAHTPEDFNKICNILSEYGAQVKVDFSSENYYKEHYRLILARNAIRQLAKGS